MDPNKPDRFCRLRALLVDVFDEPSPEYLAQLHSELDQARPFFLRLLEVPNRNKAEEEELKKGTFKYEGQLQKANEDFIHEALFLASQLDCSEVLAAVLLQAGMRQIARSGRESPENAIVIFYSERRDCLASLQMIISGAMQAGLEESGIRRILENYVSGMVQEEVDIPGGSPSRGRWALRVIKEVDNSLKSAVDLHQAIVSPPSAPNRLNNFGPSTSSATPQKARARFNDEINFERVRLLRQERRDLAHVLYLLAYQRLLRATEVQALVRWLMSVGPGDNVIVYMTVTILCALDTTPERRPWENQLRDPTSTPLGEIFYSKEFIASAHSDIVQKPTQWKLPQLRAVVQLQWTILLLEAFRSNPNLENETGVRQDHVEEAVNGAITDGALVVLRSDILGFKSYSEALDSSKMGIDTDVGPRFLVGSQSPLSMTPDEPIVDSPFEPHVVDQVDLLITNLIILLSPVLRKIKNREEDMLLASSRSSRNLAGTAAGPSQRHDLESLFLLMATLYRDEPDYSLKFWSEDDIDSLQQTSVTRYQATAPGRLPAFVRWGAECRTPGMVRAFFEMLASLAYGPVSATRAFEFLSGNGDAASTSSAPGGLVSWSQLFGAFEYYSNTLPDAQNPAAARTSQFGYSAHGIAHTSTAYVQIPPEEAMLLKAFTRLLRVVVSFSSVARVTLYDSQRYRPIQTLLGLVIRPIPIELKAGLLDAVAAFSGPSGKQSMEVARQTWTVLEQSQVLPTVAISGSGLSGFNSFVAGQLPVGGILTELEEVESPGKTYPATSAFVNLLASLIHPPPKFRKGADPLENSSIPENLGAPSRPPGVSPYVKFVVEEVLAKAGSREYQNPAERWSVTRGCLNFIDKSLASYDLGPVLAQSDLVGQMNPMADRNRPIEGAASHPAFDILLYILSNSKVLSDLLSIVSAGLDAIKDDRAQKTLYKQCVLLSMRILYRTFHLQDPFTEVILPAVTESNLALPSDKVSLIRTVQRLDQHLLYSSEVVIQIALLVGCYESNEIALLAVKIISHISDSPLFNVADRFRDIYRVKMNRLAGLIDSSDETFRIIDAFVGRLEADLPPSADEEPITSDEEAMLVFAEEVGDNDATVEQAIRSSILDLLLKNTQRTRPYPNLAHLLLGYGIRAPRAEIQLEDTHSRSARMYCVHVIIKLLDQPRPSEEQDGIELHVASLLSKHPTFAEKCYRLINQLCTHEYTSTATMRFLRTSEDFFLKQTLAIPFEVPSSNRGALGNVVYANGSRVVTSCSSLSSTLHSQAELFETVALEMSHLASADQRHRASDLAQALFGVPEAIDHRHQLFSRDRPEQGVARILECFLALDFTWQDSIEDKHPQLSIFAGVPFDSCLKPDDRGCLIYDFPSVISLLAAARREVQYQTGDPGAQQRAIKEETKLILETLVVENHRREIDFARLRCLKAWRLALDVSLGRAFHLVPYEGRHGLLIDLLSSVLPPLASDQVDVTYTEFLAGAAVSLITKLREEKRRQGGDSFDGSAFAADRLHGVLRGILRALASSSASAAVRGNLYATLLNYLQFARGSEIESDVLAPVDDSSSTVDDDLISIDGASSLGGMRPLRRSVLDAGNLTILQGEMDKILPMICRDAAIGAEVWRTVAFTVLDAILVVTIRERVASKLLSRLSKQGFLQDFVVSLQESQDSLLDMLRKDPDSLNPLYVYEAKMSFLIRVASIREGAERLMEAQVIARLAQSAFISARPEVDAESMDTDGFLPPVVERYRQMLQPALQLILGILDHYGPESVAPPRQAISFLLAQREPLLMTFKDASLLTSVTAVREAQLVARIMDFVLPILEDEDLGAPSGFGGLHTALLRFAGKILPSSSWVRTVTPESEREQLDAQTVIPGTGVKPETNRFHEKVDELNEETRLAILTYLVSASHRKGADQHFRPVLSPSLGQDEHSAASGGHAPSVGTMLSFLRESAAILAARLEVLTDLNIRVEEYDRTRTEGFREIVSTLAQLDRAEPPQAALLHLTRLRDEARSRAASTKNFIEIGLLLFWRHVSFYISEAELSGSRTRPDLSVSSSRLSRSGSVFGRMDPSQYREEAGSQFRPIWLRLANLDLSAGLGSRVRTDEAYLQAILRTIGDTLRISV